MKKTIGTILAILVLSACNRAGRGSVFVGWCPCSTTSCPPCTQANARH